MRTKGKWEVRKTGVGGRNYIILSEGMGSITNDIDDDNAEYICKAVNNHEKLITALKEISKLRNLDIINSLDIAKNLLKELGE